jgi:precorrin-6A/cobalt-precorrin-6A reductase
MSQNLLILGGTSEATQLSKLIALAKIKATLSFAGRVERTKTQPIPKRVGGFGGAEGLRDYLINNNITHVVDATHPFAEQISWNTFKACTELRIPFAALTRPAWLEEPEDNWKYVDSVKQAADKLTNYTPTTVFLAIGRIQVPEFKIAQHHRYILRLVDPYEGNLPLKITHTIISRGPFKVDDDIRLMIDNKVNIIICKNSGGAGAVSKLLAGRRLELPVIMVNRPKPPKRTTFYAAAEIMEWLEH